MIELESTSPLVARVQAFEQLQRVRQYLHNRTYGSYGVGSMSWAHWYDDIESAVEVLRAAEESLRYDIAKRIGTVIED